MVAVFPEDIFSDVPSSNSDCRAWREKRCIRIKCDGLGCAWEDDEEIIGKERRTHVASGCIEKLNLVEERNIGTDISESHLGK